MDIKTIESEAKELAYQLAALDLMAPDFKEKYERLCSAAFWLGHHCEELRREQEDR